jgi:predicted site-specific integrase-resolvase
MTPKQFREELHISEATFYRWKAAGEFTSVRICGRTLIPRESLDDLIAKGIRPAKEVATVGESA